MKKPYKIIVTLYTVIAVLMAAHAFAGEARSPIPFGGYQKNGKCGFYGAKTVIKSVDEARRVIEGFLVGHDLQIGNIEERNHFFRAELVDGNGTLQDVVIVNKINGRVRSTY